MRISYAIYSSFRNAARDAGPGYNDPNVIAKAVKKRHRIQVGSLLNLPSVTPHTFAAFGIVMARSARRPLRVLDVGGAFGGYYAMVRKAFEAEVDWSIVETPVIVNYARDWIANPDVHFVESLAEITNKSFDLVILNGVLQYHEDWASVLLDEAIRKATWVFISRTPMADKEICFLQTVEYEHAVIRYPGRVMNRLAMEELLKPSHDLFTSWIFQTTAAGDIAYDAPSLLWRNRSLESERIAAANVAERPGPKTARHRKSSASASTTSNKREIGQPSANQSDPTAGSPQRTKDQGG